MYSNIYWQQLQQLFTVYRYRQIHLFTFQPLQYLCDVSTANGQC